jgi:hypothetical protein
MIQNSLLEHVLGVRSLLDHALEFRAHRWKNPGFPLTPWNQIPRIFFFTTLQNFDEKL